MPISGVAVRIRLLVLAALWSAVSAATAADDFRGEFYTLPSSVALNAGQTFDYIVVGAGAGGAAVAARLAIAGNDVLLVEAGGDPNLLTRIPAAAMALLGSPMDWQYKTRSNNVSCLASVGRQCRFSRGKCLGGSTSINYMLYTRGNRRSDFEGIPFPGWTFNDLMPYFLRYEGLEDLFQLPSSSKYYHNTTGTIRIAFFDDSENPWHSRLIRSFKSLHFPYNNDINAESQIGVSKVVGYVYRGQRMSPARGYLAREDVRRSLKVAKNTLCTGVIIDDHKVAHGVTVVQSSQTLRLYARKEVILSAGTIGTPQILMMSGVGPAEHLSSLGIPVKVELPVGEEMTDHVLPLLMLQVPKSAAAIDQLRLMGESMAHMVRLLIQRRGAFTSNGLTDITAFANLNCYDFKLRRLTNESSDDSDCEVPNLQIIHAYIERNLIPLLKPLVRQATGFNDEVIEQLSEANTNYAFIAVSPVLLNARSVGTVRLASRDPLAPPVIYPNYLSDERDVEDMVRSIEIVEDVAASSIFRRRQASLLRLRLRQCPSYEAAPRPYWRCYVRHMTYAVHHAAGTAPLGRVLDARLRVRGVARLRVADLSALPRPPRASTAAVAMAIRERLAQFLLDDVK